MGIEEIRQTLPEFPDRKINDSRIEHDLTEDDAAILTESRELADTLERTKKGAHPKKVANWIMTESLGELKGADIKDCWVSPEQLGV